MRFASLGSSNVSDYASAGKQGADSAVKSFAIQRKYGPDYAGLSKVAMAAQTAEKIAANEAQSKFAKASINAVTDVKRTQIKADAGLEVNKYDIKSRKAGILPAIGKIAGSAFKKDPKRPPPQLQVAPVQPEKVEWPGSSVTRPEAPEGANFKPIPTGSAPVSSSDESSQTVSPVSDGGTYSKTDLQTLATNAGFPSDLAPTIAAIAMGESSGNPRAHNPDSTTGDNSYGLMQINMLGDMGPSRRQQFGLKSNEELFDPATNFRAAFDIYKSQGLGAWGAYTNGSYKKFL